ncbi:MAG: DUF3108 domain-containing protein [Steroidobacteraceae bacterium]
MLMLALCAAAVGWSGAAAAAQPSPFTAVYALAWHGITAGDSTLELAEIGPGTYRYRSVNRARGLFRLAFPHPITQQSDFALVDGRVRPLAYLEDDGPDRARNNVTLQFDWTAGRVRGTAGGKPVDQPLAPGTEDPLSVQIELMRELEAGKQPTRFLLFDKTDSQEYRYTRERPERLDTAIGSLDTVVYRSDRPGSDRVLRLWLAPSLGYLPVRAERRRRGKIEFELHIRSLSRGPAATAGTSAAPAATPPG